MCLFLIGQFFCIQIESLEQELQEIEDKKTEYEEQIEEESQSQGKDLNLQEDQVILILWILFIFVYLIIYLLLNNNKIYMRIVQYPKQSTWPTRNTSVLFCLIFGR